MKKFEEIENKPSKKWFFVVPDDLHYSEYIDIFKNLVKRAKLRMIYFAVDFTQNHSHCYFEFSVPRTLEYMKSFSFGSHFVKVTGSPPFIYSYLEDGIKQGVIYSFFKNGKVVENEIKNDTLIDVSKEKKKDFSQYSVCISFEDGSFINRFFKTKSELDEFLIILNKADIKYCVYQKSKKGD